MENFKIHQTLCTWYIFLDNFVWHIPCPGSPDPPAPPSHPPPPTEDPQSLPDKCPGLRWSNLVLRLNSSICFHCHCSQHGSTWGRQIKSWTSLIEFYRNIFWPFFFLSFWKSNLEKRILKVVTYYHSLSLIFKSYDFLRFPDFFLPLFFFNV